MSLSRASLVLAIATIGCGGTTVFRGETAFSIAGVAPAAPEVKAEVKADPPGRVIVKADRVEITEKIQFDVNKSTIKPESTELLDEIAKTLIAHPEIKGVRTEGHASAEGDPRKNVKLSDARARSVVAALQKRGVKTSLLAKGFGDKQPIAENTTEVGRSKNRRVEFIITEGKGEPTPEPVAAAPAPAAPAPATPAAPAAPAAPAPVAAAPAPAGDVPKEGYTMQWSDIMHARIQPNYAVGMPIAFTCPPMPAGKTLADFHVYGGANDEYSNSGSICATATHAGKITPAKGGTFVVYVHDAVAQYKGTSANGVKAEDKPKFSDKGYGFVSMKVVTDGKADWSSSAAKWVSNVPGQSYDITCKPTPKPQAWSVYGGEGGVYYWQSAVCPAAAHQGKCTPEKGCTITITTLEARRDFKSGGDKNGVKSRDEHLSATGVARPAWSIK